MQSKADANSSKKDRECLERLRKFRDMHNQVPLEDRELITNPEKYSFPVGMDDDGNLNISQD
jgi:hypothetical protein